MSDGTERTSGGAPPRHVERRAAWRVRLVPLIALLALVVLLVGVRTLVRTAPSAPSLAPGPILLEGRPLAPTDPAELAALRSACRRGSSGHAAALERVRAEHVPGSVVDSRTVLACPAGHDGLEVRLVGEVVGDVLLREGGAWLTLNDDAHAREAGPLVGHGARRGTNRGLAVWAPDGTHERLGTPGRAGRRGDLVVVVGTVHRADPADRGGLTVRASDLEVLVPGAVAEAPLHQPQALAALVALGAVALLAGRRLAAAWRPAPWERLASWGRRAAGRVSAGRADPRAARTGRAPRPGRKRSRADGRRRPDAHGG